MTTPSQARRSPIDVRDLRRELRAAYREYRRADDNKQLMLSARHYMQTLATAISLAGHLEREWYPNKKKRKKRGPDARLPREDALYAINIAKEHIAKEQKTTPDRIRDTVALRYLFSMISRNTGKSALRIKKDHERSLRTLLSKARKSVTK